jgi:hypothetical protein
MIKKQISIFVVISCLVLLSLACGFSTGKSQTQSIEKTVSVSNEAAQSLETAVSLAVEQAQNTNQTTITITEAQVTSYAALQLASDPNFSFIKNPQIRFQNGQIEVLGNVEQGILSTSIHLNLKAEVDPNGSVKITMVSANLGSMPAPQSLTDSITSITDQYLNKYLMDMANGFKIESLAIDNGTMTLSGIKR